MALAILFLLIYLVYIPNFLYIKSVKVAGADVDAAGGVQRVVSEYFSKAFPLRAQKHIVFLNPQSLQNYLLDNDKLIFKINKIKKNWWSRTLTVEITQKVEQFAVVTNMGSYAVYNDGTVSREISSDPAQPPPQELIRLNYSDSGILETNQTYLSGDFAAKLVFIKKSFEEILHSQVDSFQMLPQNPDQPVQNANTALPTNTAPDNTQVTAEMKTTSPLNPPDLSINLKKNNLPAKSRVTNFAVYLDLIGDLNSTLAKLNLLLNQMDPARYQNLFYVDMRLPDKAYLCLVNTPCTRPVAPPVPVNPIAPMEPPTNQPTKK